MKKILSFALFVFVCGTGVSVAKIPSVDLVDQKIGVLNTALGTKASDSEVVKLDGAQTITGAKTFSGAVTLTNAPAADSNNNQVATTAWTNARVTAAKGEIPVGSATSSTFTKIWLEE